jgi:probable F420-dependent oxidoreductase
VRIGATLGFDGGRGRGMDAVAEVARHAEEVGVDSLWFPEHVVFVEGARSPYPYSVDGSMNFGRRPGVFDPLVAMTVAATVTDRIRLGTGVLILPEHEPLALAQRVVAVDHASAGRIDLGIGTGWLREEFEAIGVPWAGRGARTDEYVAALRVLWRDEVASYDGDVVSFRGVQAWPKPVQQPGVPIWVGGNTPPALRRAATIGDGWFGWALGLGEVASCIDALRAGAEAAGRPADAVALKVGLAWPGDLAELTAYAAAVADLGVEELVVAPAAPRTDTRQRLDELARLGATVVS